jgi:hypothetical protein
MTAKLQALNDILGSNSFAPRKGVESERKNLFDSRFFATMSKFKQEQVKYRNIAAVIKKVPKSH